MGKHSQASTLQDNSRMSAVVQRKCWKRWPLHSTFGFRRCNLPDAPAGREPGISYSAHISAGNRWNRGRSCVPAGCSERWRKVLTGVKVGGGKGTSDAAQGLWGTFKKYIPSTQQVERGATRRGGSPSVAGPPTPTPPRSQVPGGRKGRPGWAISPESDNLFSGSPPPPLKNRPVRDRL